MSGRSDDPRAVSRRDLLKGALTASVGFGALPFLLAGCGGAPVPATATAKPTAGASGRGTPFPSYIPTANKPKPDFPSAGVLYEDGYVNYPASPFKSVADTPGQGGNVTIFVQPLQPPPAPLDQNPAWKEVNKQLNANVQFNLAPSADYQAKLAAMIAGGDLPDIMNLFRGLNGAPNTPQFLEQAAADLTPYLSGDAIKAYPNLAAIPTFAWQNCGAMYKGKLYMVPVERYAPGQQLYRDISIYDKEIGTGYVPKNADDLKRIMQQLNRPSEGRYATGSYQSVAFDVDFYKSIFGAPNNWRLESDGKLTKDWETQEYRETVGFLRDLVSAGLFHPDTLTYTNSTQSTVQYTAGKWVLYVLSFGVSWAQIWRYGLQRKPPVDYAVIYPFAAHDGQKPTHQLSLGYQSATAVKKASADRVQELLRILNYLAAPFGSQEDLVLTSGIKDIDYTLDANGNPVLNERGNLDANNVPWKYVMQHPQVMYTPDIPGLSKAEYEAEQVEIPLGVADPSQGYYSSTFSSKGTLLTKAFMDGVTDVISSRRPLEDLAKLVADWQSAGGNQIRTELAQAISAAS
jgi:putative aldouronate transport system substrate-binding protein